MYRVIEAARRRALAIADPLGGRRSLDEEFARRCLIAEIALVPQITIGVYSLIGQSDEPAVLHGYGSIPADVARGLAVQATTFRRVLVDAADGAQLALDQYPRRMRELFPGAAAPPERQPHGRWRAWQGGDGTLRWLSPTGHGYVTAPASTIGCTRGARAGPPPDPRSDRPPAAASRYPDPPPF